MFYGRCCKSEIIILKSSHQISNCGIIIKLGLPHLYSSRKVARERHYTTVDFITSLYASGQYNIYLILLNYTNSRVIDRLLYWGSMTSTRRLIRVLDVARRERNTGSVYTTDNRNSHWLWERDARLFQASAGSALRQYVSRLRGHLRRLDFGQQPGELRHDQAHLLPQASQGGDLRLSGEHLAGQLVTRHVCFAAHAGSHIDEEFYIRTVYVLLPAYVTGHTDTRDHDDVRAHRRRQISILNRPAQGQNSSFRLRHGLLVLRHLLGAAVPGLHFLLRRRGIAASSWASAVLRQFNGRY
uniref:Uncharacterized protein n=1 Tax=Trichogramma kaykai TaxID=54128 RepID=A0ABD2VVC6_9HYME